MEIESRSSFKTLLKEFAGQHRRHIYLLLLNMLGNDGWNVNVKRTCRRKKLPVPFFGIGENYRLDLLVLCVVFADPSIEKIQYSFRLIQNGQFFVNRNYVEETEVVYRYQG